MSESIDLIINAAKVRRGSSHHARGVTNGDNGAIQLARQRTRPALWTFEHERVQDVKSKLRGLAGVAAA